ARERHAEPEAAVVDASVGAGHETEDILPRLFDRHVDDRDVLRLVEDESESERPHPDALAAPGVADDGPHAAREQTPDALGHRLPGPRPTAGCSGLDLRHEFGCDLAEGVVGARGRRERAAEGCDTVRQFLEDDLRVLAAIEGEDRSADQRLEPARPCRTFDSYDMPVQLRGRGNGEI